MAATSGTLSSTSTSTQSPASSNSGTPGPTSQSSGTLVVPSFISTYISFGGPSIVSTLPATSSTNLSVVVGGSCGGATGSESSTFPNINKAFMVDPGYAPVPYKLVSKITAGLFVDLAGLLWRENWWFRVSETGHRNSRYLHLDRSLHNLFYDSLPHLPLSLERFKSVQVTHYSYSKALF